MIFMAQKYIHVLHTKAALRSRDCNLISISISTVLMIQTFVVRRQRLHKYIKKQPIASKGGTYTYSIFSDLIHFHLADVPLALVDHLLLFHLDVQLCWEGPHGGLLSGLALLLLLQEAGQVLWDLLPPRQQAVHLRSSLQEAISITCQDYIEIQQEPNIIFLSRMT